MPKKNKNKQNPGAGGQSHLPYEHCMDCGTELKGMYCYRCGQKALD